MNSKEDSAVKITGFVTATPGWYVLDTDPDAEGVVILRAPIVGWMITEDRLAMPVSPQYPMLNIPPTTAIESPGGKVFNRLDMEWKTIESYKRSLIREQDE